MAANRNVLYLRQSATSANSTACINVLRQLPPNVAEKYFELKVFKEGQPKPDFIQGFPTLFVEYNGQQLVYGGAKCVETVQAMVSRLASQAAPAPPVMRQPLPIAAPAQSIASQHALPAPPQSAGMYRQPSSGLIPIGNMGGRGYHVAPLVTGTREDGQPICRPAFESSLIRAQHNDPSGGCVMKSDTGSKGDVSAELAKYKAHLDQTSDHK